MFTYTIEKTTTFFSQDELVDMIREKNPDIKLENFNEQFIMKDSATQAGGVQWFLQYECINVGEFLFPCSFEYKEDKPMWKTQLGADNKIKYKLDIVNWHPVAYGGIEAPADIYIKPLAYSQFSKLAWSYVPYEKVDCVIEIFEVKDGHQHWIYTLTSTDFARHDKSWLKSRKPIVIEKHQTYITIRPSASLNRMWGVHESYVGNTNFIGYTMSEDETAWISPDVPRIARQFLKAPSDTANQASMQVMLAQLGQLGR